MKCRTRRFDCAARRWEGLGPYYAMFPTSFADGVVRRYTQSGETVLDPFAGRGTALFSAASQGRCGIGIELNTVGWVYAQTKLHPVPLEAVLDRLQEIGQRASTYCRAAHSLPLFFHHAYSSRVRSFLLSAREQLDWRRNRIDRTLMALLLVYLHGKQGASLSNQMRQTKSLSPDYAIRWWTERGFQPPDLDSVEFLRPRLEWRYAHGRPEATNSRAYLGDSIRRLGYVGRQLRQQKIARPRLLFTSPPYYGVTNYHYDQWLRLWLLGGPSNALRTGGRYRGKFEHKANYRLLLQRVFGQAAQILDAKATVYVRTDRRSLTSRMTREVLKQTFPAKRLRSIIRPLHGKTQTRLFGGDTPKVGEVDVILHP